MKPLKEVNCSLLSDPSDLSAQAESFKSHRRPTHTFRFIVIFMQGAGEEREQPLECFKFQRLGQKGFISTVTTRIITELLPALPWPIAPWALWF